ncbi:hypothetical protein DFH06DRAFT_1320804 [Mycena polygramma]|nr:hypothetical protein DFH06DRAFT_1320804 [Mycena polygramma]
MVSADIWQLFEDCWEQERDKRPPMTEIAPRLVTDSIEANIKQPDWDETYSARFRRSVQEWPMLPSVSEIKHKILVMPTQGWGLKNLSRLRSTQRLNQDLD